MSTLAPSSPAPTTVLNSARTDDPRVAATSADSRRIDRSNAPQARSPHNLPDGTEVRGFALYVGLADDKIADGDPALGTIVTELKRLIAQLSPTAETYAAVALAPVNAGGRDVDVVRLALGDPAAQAHQKQETTDSDDRAASGVTLDLSRKRVLLDNAPAALTFREFELLQYLVLREGQTISRDELIQALWSAPSDDEVPNERTVDVHVRRLRIKLRHYQDIVRTVRGTGYRFDRHADVNIVNTHTHSPDAL